MGLKKNTELDLYEEYGFATRSIHAGQSPAPENQSVITPVFQTSTYSQPSPGQHTGYEYARTHNPTREALEANIASLECGTDGTAFSSGCSAMAAVLHCLKAGDHVVYCDDVYGGTYRLFEDVFADLGIEFSRVDLIDPESLKGHLTEKTKLLWIESPTNPMLQILDIEALVTIAHANDTLVAVDNTFCSPYVQTPLLLGADIVVHSTTKYLGGHSDVVGGIVVTRHPELGDKFRYYQNAVGAIPGPWDCFLNLRSTKTLAIRMEQHSVNGTAIAEMLESHEAIEWVRYPFLKSHPQYELAKKQMRLGTGMVTCELKGGLNAAQSFLESIKLFLLAESLGGVESLANHPALMTHATIPRKEREALGITDGLVRLSVGIEDLGDLKADLNQALSK